MTKRPVGRSRHGLYLVRPETDDFGPSCSAVVLKTSRLNARGIFATLLKNVDGVQPPSSPQQGDTITAGLVRDTGIAGIYLDEYVARLEGKLERTSKPAIVLPAPQALQPAGGFPQAKEDAVSTLQLTHRLLTNREPLDRLEQLTLADTLTRQQEIVKITVGWFCVKMYPEFPYGNIPDHFEPAMRYIAPLLPRQS